MLFRSMPVQPEDPNIEAAMDVARRMEDPAQRIQAGISALSSNLAGLDLEANVPQFHTGLPQTLVGGAGEGGALMGYPSIANIQLFPSDEYLYKFKPAVIESMQVNFAPGNTPGFFKNSQAPTEVLLTIQVKEIVYWLAEDVAGVDRGSLNSGILGILQNIF